MKKKGSSSLRKKRKLLPAPAADWRTFPSGILLPNECPIHPNSGGGSSSRGLRSREGEPLLFCERCGVWLDLPELVARQLHCPLADAIPRCFHAEVPASILAREIAWRTERARFLDYWEAPKAEASRWAADVVELPFGEWGMVDRADFLERFPGWAAGLGVRGWTLSERQDARFFAARLLRDEFGRPTGFQAHQVHRERLFLKNTVRFQPGAGGLTFVCRNNIPSSLEWLLTDDPALAGQLERGLAGWLRPPVLAVPIEAGPPAAGAWERATIVARTQNAADALSTAPMDAGVETRLVVDPPVNALAHEAAFRQLERPAVRPTPVSDQTLTHDGHVYRRAAGRYWRDERAVTDFVLDWTGDVERNDEIIHGLRLVFSEDRGGAEFSLSAERLLSACGLHLAAWQAARLAGLPAPVLASPALRRLLPALVAATQPPAPLVRDRPKILEDFATALAADPQAPAQYVSFVRGRRLLSPRWFAPYNPRNPNPQIQPDELSFALRQVHGAAFGWVRTGKHKTTRALRIP